MAQDIEQGIVDYFLQKFPFIKGIILLGSRANGHARPHSDWDLFFLIDQDFKALQVRDCVLGQNIDYTFLKLPVENIQDRFDGLFKVIRILYDSEGYAAKLVTQAEEDYRQPFPTRFNSPEGLINRKYILKFAVAGMQGSLNDPFMFWKKFRSFYPLAVDIWYRVVLKEHPENIYITLPRMEQEDPELYRYFETFLAPITPLSERANAAEKITHHIFPELAD